MEELSVYDLKDHADYQYRPGTMVIRVSNFTGDDLNSTAGQVIDNFPDGRVRVWWAKGHITMCYPQDLFEIHQSEAQDAYESDETDNSWETQSENSQTVDMSVSAVSLNTEEHIISGIDRAKDAIQRLEKIFRVLPDQRKADVLNDLLGVYKNCRYLDRFLNTDFFHEDYFTGILSVKEKSECQTPTSAVTKPQGAFAAADEAKTILKVPIPQGMCAKVSNSPIKLLGSPLSTLSSTPNKRKSSTNMDEVQCKKNTTNEVINVEDPTEQALLLCNVELTESESQLNYNDLVNKYREEYAEMIRRARASIVKAFEKSKNEKVRNIYCIFIIARFDN